jgi:hypothetical protein
MTILEVGCGTYVAQHSIAARVLTRALQGTGAAIFPLLSANHNPSLSLRAYDYSKHAIKLVQVCSLSCFSYHLK